MTCFGNLRLICFVLGRRILFFYANAYILNQPLSPTIKTSSSPSPEAILEPEPEPESEGSARETPVSTVSSETNTYLAPTPFEHPDYKSIDTATYDNIGRWTDEVELAKIARASGLYQVMRWKPTNVSWSFFFSTPPPLLPPPSTTHTSGRKSLLTG